MQPIATPEATRSGARPQLRRGLLLAVTLAFILSLPWITGSTASATQEAEDVTEQEQPDPTWLKYQDEVLRLSYPPAWALEVDAASEEKATYHLRAPGEQDAHVVVRRHEGPTATLDTLERQFVRAIEADERLASRFIRILPPTRIAGHLAARVQYAARLASGEQVRGLWIGLLQPDRPALLFHLHGQTTRYFQVHAPPYNRMLAAAAYATTPSAL